METQEQKPNYQPAEGNQAPLEDLVKNELPLSPKDQETYFTREQAQIIINQAQILQELNSRESSQSRIESILSEIPQNEISLSTIYKVANKTFERKIF